MSRILYSASEIQAEYDNVCGEYNKLREAVNRKCWECVGFDYDQRAGAILPWKKIRSCKIDSCAIYPVRTIADLKGLER